jgi:putative endonuclease
MKRQATGAFGEKLARDFLENNGYGILETNYRCAEGEIDIIARQGKTLVFIEVRTKSSRKFGSPEESITTAKMRKLRAVVAHYLTSHDNLPESWRIDMVVIELDRHQRPSRIEIIENAVGGI